MDSRDIINEPTFHVTASDLRFFKYSLHQTAYVIAEKINDFPVYLFYWSEKTRFWKPWLLYSCFRRNIWYQILLSTVSLFHNAFLYLHHSQVNLKVFAQYFWNIIDVLMKYWYPQAFQDILDVVNVDFQEAFDKYGMVKSWNLHCMWREWIQICFTTAICSK